MLRAFKAGMLAEALGDDVARDVATNLVRRMEGFLKNQASWDCCWEVPGLFLGQRHHQKQHQHGQYYFWKGKHHRKPYTYLELKLLFDMMRQQKVGVAKWLFVSDCIAPPSFCPLLRGSWFIAWQIASDPQITTSFLSFPGRKLKVSDTLIGGKRKKVC